MNGALGAVAGVTIGAIALTETFELLPAAVLAYAAAWWVLRLDTTCDRGPPMTTDEHRFQLEPELETEADARRTRASVRARHLAELMERRPDLFGVYPAADLVADSVRWTA